MTDFKQGDRVITGSWRTGTIIRIDGRLAHLLLDDSILMTAWVGSLKKTDSEATTPDEEEKPSD